MVSRKQVLIRIVLIILSADSSLRMLRSLLESYILIGNWHLVPSMHVVLVEFAKHRSAWCVRQRIIVADFEMIGMIQTDHNPFFNSLWHRAELRLDDCHDF